jgi:hypothetical protein
MTTQTAYIHLSDEELPLAFMTFGKDTFSAWLTQMTSHTLLQELEKSISGAPWFNLVLRTRAAAP